MFFSNSQGHTQDIKESSEAYQKACDEAIGQNVDEYTQKMDFLKKRWDKKQDSTPMRLISPLLFLKTAPLYHSVIADHIEYFREHYNKEKINLNAVLAMACLCGSQKIAEFLLNDLNLTYLSEGQEKLLSYASASMNVEWVKSIATTMAEAGKKMPDEVIVLADDQMIDMITAIFEGKTSKNTQKPKA